MSMFYGFLFSLFFVRTIFEIVYCLMFALCAFSLLLFVLFSFFVVCVCFSFLFNVMRVVLIVFMCVVLSVVLCLWMFPCFVFVGFVLLFLSFSLCRVLLVFLPVCLFAFLALSPCVYVMRLLRFGFTFVFLPSRFPLLLLLCVLFVLFSLFVYSVAFIFFCCNLSVYMFVVLFCVCCSFYLRVFPCRFYV